MMKKTLFFVICVCLLSPILNAQGQQTQQSVPEVSDEILLELYKGARVSDVVDALVTCGYMGVNVMDRNIAPLWRDLETMSHQISGIAATVRYGPTNRPMHPGADLTLPENYNIYREWRLDWYGNIAPESWIEAIIKKGTVLVIDNKDDNDTGTTGSNNIMLWQNQGAVGVVSAGGVRDTDEIMRQKNPVYTDYTKRGRGERIGRNELIDVQQPVVVGGVLVHPGDVIVANSDGVVVVPRRVAIRVGQIAYMELWDDLRARRRLYEKQGRTLDSSVILEESPAAFFTRLGLPEDPNQ